MYCQSALPRDTDHYSLARCACHLPRFRETRNDVRAMALKRLPDEDGSADVTTKKRLKPLHADRVSRLSDELILRILSNLTLVELLTCER
jgi:hypothetical protein